MLFTKITGVSPEFAGNTISLYINPQQITIVTPLGSTGCTVRLSCGTVVNVKDQTAEKLLEGL
jgi:hypothetical protein